MNQSRFAVFAWVYLAFNVLVIIWGGVVRATGSGAGCGAHWPTCNGQIIPTGVSWHTYVEFSHRISTGVLGILTIVLVVWAFHAYPRGHAVRLGSLLSAFFILTESAIGAGLVLLEYVAYNVSVARAYWMAGHLVNTLLLVAAVALTAYWASGGERLQLRRQGAVGWLLLLALASMFVVGASGAIAALGDTLLVGLGIAKDESHLMAALTGVGVNPAEAAIVAALVELRILHPVIAVASGVLITAAAWLARTRRPGALTRHLSTITIGLVAGQVLLGALNVALKAPVWIQMAHLLVTNLLWIALVLLAADALDRRAVPAPAQTAPVGAASSTPA